MSLPQFSHPAPNPAWLARRAEPIIDPDLPIIDPHHHLWSRHGDYFLDELLADTGSGHRIVATVFAQCAWAYRKDGPPELRPVGETEFVAAIAEQAERRDTATRVCAGIVGHADMTLGERVGPVLDAHIAAGRGRFRGIRHLTARSEFFTASIAPPEPAALMRRPEFHAGVAQLQRRGLSFDGWLYHTQIDEFVELAQRFPDVPMVLDHVGGPLGIGPYRDRRDAVFAEWRGAMLRLAACPNAHVKLGGLAMLVAGFGFHEHAEPPSSDMLATAWRPYIETCIDAFGASRCMFESNFPVDKAMCSYPVLWNAFKRLAAAASTDERTALFQGTAARVYRIAP